MIAALGARCIVWLAMRWILTAAVLLTFPAYIGARPILYDPLALNIGVNCQWQARCMDQQRRAMKRSLAYVGTMRPGRSRVELCNRNARRSTSRVDWVGFDNCIRNASLRLTRASLKRTKR